MRLDTEKWMQNCALILILVTRKCDQKFLLLIPDVQQEPCKTFTNSQRFESFVFKRSFQQVSSRRSHFNSPSIDPPLPNLFFRLLFRWVCDTTEDLSPAQAISGSRKHFSLLPGVRFSGASTSSSMRTLMWARGAKHHRV